MIGTDHTRSSSTHRRRVWRRRRVHGNEPPLAPRGGSTLVGNPLDMPIVLSSAFAFGSTEEAAGAFLGENDAHIYGR
ncbi:MAG: hypothetical protein M3O50_02015 [Myxococcota bacterium]|nr:hypothetical protein [Myxococcota bacterium]